MALLFDTSLLAIIGSKLYTFIQHKAQNAEWMLHPNNCAYSKGVINSSIAEFPPNSGALPQQVTYKG